MVTADWDKKFEEWKKKEEKKKEIIVNAVPLESEEIQKTEEKKPDFHVELLEPEIPPRVSVTKAFIVLIPIIILIYLLSINFVFPQEFNYFYDIGSEKDNYLSPTARVTDISSNNEITHRNMTDSLVYFTAEIPSGSEYVNVQTRYKRYVPEEYYFKLGARDKSEEWHYLWKEFENRIIDEQGWITAETTFYFNEDNLTIKDGKLSFVFNAENLRDNTKGETISIDWINITIYKPGLIGENK